MNIFIGLYILLIIIFGALLLEIHHNTTSRIMKFLYIPLGGAVALNIGMLGLVYIFLYHQNQLPFHIILDFISPLRFLFPVYGLWILFDIGILLNVIGLLYFSFHYPESIISTKINTWFQRLIIFLSILVSSTFFFRMVPVLESEYMLWLERIYFLPQWYPILYAIVLGIGLTIFLYQLHTSFHKTSVSLRLSMLGLLIIFIIAFIISILFLITSFPTEILLLFLPLLSIIWIPIIALFYVNYMVIINIRRIGIYLSLMGTIVFFFIIMIQNQHLVSFIFDLIISLLVIPIVIFIITFLKKEETYLITQRKANKELEEIVKVKDTFIHMTAHQIRSPLLVLEEYLRILLEGENFSIVRGENRSDIIRMYSNVERLKTTVNDVSLANNISEDQGIFHEKQKLDLVEIITSIINERKELTHESDLTVVFDYHQEHTYYVEGDPMWLQEACSKVIDNALLFSSTQVTITLDTEDSYIRLCVTDDGMGITSEEQEYIFTRFYRSQRALHVHPDGSGLGLYLAQYIIHIHHGIIKIISQGKDQGTQCKILLQQIK